MSSMFPVIPSDIPATAATDIGRVPAFDSETERFLTRDGALVERSGQAAVQQWIDLMLRQQIGRVPIYATSGSASIGIDRSLLGSRVPSGLAAAELERNVRETMSFCPAIRLIQDVKVSRQGRTCQVAFTAVLYTGETVEVTTNV